MFIKIISILASMGIMFYIIRQSSEMQEIKDKEKMQEAYEKYTLIESEVKEDRYKVILEVLNYGINALLDLCRRDSLKTHTIIRDILNYMEKAKGSYLNGKIELSSEINLVNLIGKVMDYRYSNKISIVIDIENSIDKYTIPSFFFQRLIIYIMNTSLSNRILSGNIFIRGIKDDDRAIVIVEDTGKGLNGKEYEELNNILNMYIKNITNPYKSEICTYTMSIDSSIEYGVRTILTITGP